MGLHVSGASAQPIRCPSVIWRYQDLFLMSVGSGLPRRKLGAIVLSASRRRRRREEKSSRRERSVVDRDRCLDVIAEAVDEPSPGAQGDLARA